jgi:hypothetical protein
MFRVLPAVAATVLLVGALPAMAQDFGGVRLGSQGALLDQVEQRDPGCPLSQTNVVIGVNRAMTPGSFAQQRLGSAGSGCRPLVSAQVVAGVNLALAPGSSADQSLAASSPRGLIGTVTFGRGVNYAVGRGSAATQNILSQIGR